MISDVYGPINLCAAGCGSASWHLPPLTYIPRRRRIHAERRSLRCAAGVPACCATELPTILPRV